MELFHQEFLTQSKVLSVGKCLPDYCLLVAKGGKHLGVGPRAGLSQGSDPRPQGQRDRVEP